MNHANIFDPYAKIDEQTEFGGIKVSQYSPGSVILVRTLNSEYLIELLGDKRVTLAGGKRFTEPTPLWFNGSTFGGSMIKLDWIGFSMHMEFSFTGGKYTTSMVRDAKVFSEEESYEPSWSAY